MSKKLKRRYKNKLKPKEKAELLVEFAKANHLQYSWHNDNVLAIFYPINGCNMNTNCFLQYIPIGKGSTFRLYNHFWQNWLDNYKVRVHLDFVQHAFPDRNNIDQWKSVFYKKFQTLLESWNELQIDTSKKVLADKIKNICKEEI